MSNARFVTRAVAYIIDILIISFIASLISLPFSGNYSDNVKKIDNEMNIVQEKLLKQEIDVIEYFDSSASLIYQNTKYQGTIVLITVFIEILYFIIYQFKNNGQTIGKKLMKIRLVSSSGDLTINQVLLRSLIINTILANLIEVLMVSIINDCNLYLYIVSFVEMLSFLFIFCSAVSILYTKDKRGLHDRIFNTNVIIEKKE